MGPISFHFEDYSKSARWMILFWLVPCYHTPTLHKNAEKPTVIWFFTQIFIKSTVHCNIKRGQESIHRSTNSNSTEALSTWCFGGISPDWPFFHIRVWDSVDRPENRKNCKIFVKWVWNKSNLKVIVSGTNINIR